jgi:hypothetical protein
MSTTAAPTYAPNVTKNPGGAKKIEDYLGLSEQELYERIQGA